MQPSGRLLSQGKTVRLSSLRRTSRNQRLTFLGIAAVIAVVAVVILLTGGSDEGSTSGSATARQTATPSDTAPAAGSATAQPRAEARPRVPTLTAGEVKKLRFTEGDTIRFRVRSDAPEEVHVHGYDLRKDVEPGEPASFAFPASITGIFEVELEQSGTQLAELRVDPE